jgi:DNA-binding transcriptional LysR family regulator
MMSRAYSLQDLELCLRIAERGNMSEAGRELGLTTAAVSAAVKRLELALGVNLFDRTTRSMRLSAAGEIFIPHLQHVLDGLDVAESELRNLQTQVSGEIRLSIPSDLGRNLLLELLDSYQVLHPRVKFIVHISDSVQDLYREGLDLVIRYGEQKDSGLIAQKLCDNRRVLAASPSYIARIGQPATIEDLADHNCILFYRNDSPYSKWLFEVNGREQAVQVNGNRYANDGELVKRWALAGQGIVYKSRLDVTRELEEGSLVELLSGQYLGQQAPLYAVYKERRYQAYRITQFLSYLRQQMGGLDVSEAAKAKR